MKANTKRLLIYIAFAYGIAWVSGLVMYLNGGLANSPLVLPFMSLAAILLILVYMPAPAISHILTRLITKEGWKNLYFKPNFKHGWPFYVVAWIVTPLLVLVGALVYFLVFPSHFDPGAARVVELMESMGASMEDVPFSPMILLVVQLLQGVLIAPVLNAIPVLGEEFGWRAYMEPKLMMKMGARPALILSGIIWGVWHWPTTLMGYNYGNFGPYPGEPWSGMLMQIFVWIFLGTYIGWLRLKSQSVWPAVIAHASFNGVASISIYTLQMQAVPNSLLGPLPVGVLGALGVIIFSLAVLIIPGALEVPVMEDTEVIKEEEPEAIA